MEARRRLAVLASHFRPPLSPTSTFSVSNCDSPSDSNKDNHESACVFCKIVRGESPSFKLYEDDICLCILDLNPLTPGHSLIIPKDHYSCLETTPPSVIGAMCSKVPYISNAVVKATGCGEKLLIQALWKAKYQFLWTYLCFEIWLLYRLA